MGPICAIAERHGLRVLTDAAQGHGAVYKGQRVGIVAVGAVGGALGGVNSILYIDNLLTCTVVVLNGYMLVWAAAELWRQYYYDPILPADANSGTAAL